MVMTKKTDSGLKSGWFMVVAGAAILLIFAFFLLRPDSSDTEAVQDMPMRRINGGGNLADYNVVIVVVDALRPDHLGSYGYGRDTSPHMDALAGEGVLFSDAKSVSSWTKPTTASILTGLYPRRHGAISEFSRLKDDVETLPETLKKYGYRTFGVFSNRIAGSHAGFAQGFDRFVEYPETRITSPKLSADAISDEALDLIDEMESPSKNFLMLFYLDPHYPYVAPHRKYSGGNRLEYLTEFFDELRFYNASEDDKPWMIDEMVNAYDDEILYTDKQIGRVLDRLRERGLYDNSVIVILSDHGEEFYRHEKIGHAHNLYDEEVSILLILKAPGVEAGVSGMPVSQVDVTPTILEILGIPSAEKLDGTNMLNLINGDRVRFFELSYFANSQYAVESQQMKLLINQNPEGERRGKYLFDLKKDPGEVNNLYQDNRDSQTVKDLEKQLAEYLSQNNQSKGETKKYSNETIEALKALGYMR